MTLIKKLKEPDEILRKQELRQQCSERRLKLISEAKSILIAYLTKKARIRKIQTLVMLSTLHMGQNFKKDYFTLVPS
ncbi:hypothetical protein EEL32_10615 [Brevibacillus laterosporus]|nr:hypothetical protein EEL32_10615 [Brevibacillus laterosporus]